DHRAASHGLAADTMLFCAGHALMADGKLMVSGGHKLDDRGLDVTNIFDPVSETWQSGLRKMAKGRWYPTVTTLGDGRLVTVAGKDTTKTVVKIPEIWENNQWVQLPGASLTLPYYPRDFVDPKTGLLFMAGERVQSRWLDVDASGGSGRGQWTTGPTHIWGFNRDYGSAAMYDTGKILYVGGGGYTGWDTPDATSAVPTATAEKIDLMAGSPSWSGAGSMAQPRRHLNATVLPDGTVLVTGGVSGGGFNDIASAVHTAELWDPVTNDWTVLAPNTIDRGYHSVSLLLPDGTVLHGGSGDANVPGSSTKYPAQRNHEIFHPPYLFRGARPVITDAPTDVTYNAPFQVSTPNAAQVTSVRWIHLGAVTHSFDQSARANTLAFTRQGDGVSVTAPSSANSAPPGHYLLFILNRNGVPSVGRIIRVH
ncbi:MAG TPA: galactose oxidase-like domain-containing protein, partial [Gemmatimonadales bacterium]|nr:galactose oxidase-like domain-containing protein [Gemmatimonadales bacterium]